MERVTAVDDYYVPVDPMDDLQCDSCQRAGAGSGRIATARRQRRGGCASTVRQDWRSF